MQTDASGVELFLQKCDEVMQSKFIIADTKIGELLKAIATSDLLYALFRDITKDFDYTAAQKKYMNYLPEGTFGRRKLLFPEDPVERLAFVFCLLVDFDTGRIDLGGFLQEYFYEDGSVYGSFYAFSNQVIKPFKNAVRTMVRGRRAAPSERGRAELVRLVSSERDAVYASRMPDDKKVDALVILNALSDEAERGSPKTVAGLICGYRYFAERAGWKSAALGEMLQKFVNAEDIV
ncbi:MAG TPA: hypothetical protein H9727_03295 [Candidatus Borkfalkia avistercoris]|uniref:Uncharacterized protein n=1 Tax=Candidatus Borkfalkia avistercoris TaxID=2838504 RepID=A0A9D2ID53_9FIRM|nr:hypothetical protein [Candidatus Borkfalkia avistercoris]